MRSAPRRARASRWTTDTKISAGVLGALAFLCVGVVGWRLLEPPGARQTADAAAPDASLTIEFSGTETFEAIDALPEFDRSSRDASFDAPHRAAAAPSPVAPAVLAPPETLPFENEGQPLAVADAVAESLTARDAAPRETTADDDRSYSSIQATPAEDAFAGSATPSVVEILTDDSFWLISQRAYGTGAYFKALYRFHEASIAHPDRLPAGETLEIPPVETLRELFPEDVPVDAGENELARLRSYRTKRGDTAISVAQTQLGDGSRWTEVFRLNQRAVTSPDALLPEHYELKLPPAPGTATAPQKQDASGSSMPLR